MGRDGKSLTTHGEPEFLHPHVKEGRGDLRPQVGPCTGSRAPSLRRVSLRERALGLASLSLAVTVAALGCLAGIIWMSWAQGPFLPLPFLTAGSVSPHKASSGRSLRLPSPAASLAWAPAALRGPPAPAPLPATSPCPCRAAVLSPESPSTWCSPVSPQCCPKQAAGAPGATPLPALLDASLGWAPGLPAV